MHLFQDKDFFFFLVGITAEIQETLPPPAKVERFASICWSWGSSSQIPTCGMSYKKFHPKGSAACDTVTLGFNVHINTSHMSLEKAAEQQRTFGTAVQQDTDICCCVTCNAF